MKFDSFETSYATDLALQKYRTSEGEVGRLDAEITAAGGVTESPTELLEAFNKACDYRDKMAAYFANAVAYDFTKHGG